MYPYSKHYLPLRGKNWKSQSPSRHLATGWKVPSRVLPSEPSPCTWGYPLIPFPMKMLTYHYQSLIKRYGFYRPWRLRKYSHVGELFTFAKRKSIVLCQQYHFLCPTLYNDYLRVMCYWTEISVVSMSSLSWLLCSFLPSLTFSFTKYWCINQSNRLLWDVKSRIWISNRKN